MKKHEVLLDMINKCILFSPGYYSHLKALLVPVSTMLVAKTEIISMAIQQDVLPNRI